MYRSYRFGLLVQPLPVGKHCVALTTTKRSICRVIKRASVIAGEYHNCAFAQHTRARTCTATDQTDTRTLTQMLGGIIEPATDH
eukprot:COSAG02_NODE_6034_length_3857_cov_4.591006_1_plen_84_part_00